MPVEDVEQNEGRQITSRHTAVVVKWEEKQLFRQQFRKCYLTSSIYLTELYSCILYKRRHLLRSTVKSKLSWLCKLWNVFLPNLPYYLSKDSVNYLLGPKEANSCRDWRCKVPNIAMRLCGPLVMVKKWVNDAVDKSCQRHQNSDHRNPGKWHSHQVRWMFLVFEVTFLAGNCWFVIEPFPNHGDVHVVIIVVIHCTRR